MPLNEKNDPEMAYRRGYQDGALETLRMVSHRPIFQRAGGTLGAGAALGIARETAVWRGSSL
jgi:hypothetical protein